MDIAAWLQGLGLERYESAFRESEIDWEVLPDLTEGDLEKLGLPLGPRKKLLKAIAGLSAETTTSSTQAAPFPTPSREAERRQLSVMFSDLVGSTKLSTRLDPEEMADTLRSFSNAVCGEIARFGGHVARVLGDGVLAYFGWPVAHEDAAEQAVRAGLAVRTAVAALRAPDEARLAARVGIATGLVMVGEVIREGVAREEAVAGETPNLAARVQAVASPGQVVVAEGTRRLLGDRFEIADLGSRRLKGFANPVRAWQIVGEGRARDRFEARRTTGLSPLVGRTHELSLLLDRWVLARGGEGQAILLSGEPGIGKSRLVESLRSGNP